jgi:predicted XRE-type DNA-binding protein
MSKQIEFVKGGGNIFRDLDLPNPDLLLLKSNLGIKLIHLIGSRGLTQTAAAKMLGIGQPELSRLKGGNLSHYSVERLMGFLNKLDQRIEIHIRPSTRTKVAETVLA